MHRQREGVRLRASAQIGGQSQCTDREMGAGVQIETGRVRARVQLVGGPTLFLSVDFVNILPKKGVDRH